MLPAGAPDLMTHPDDDREKRQDVAHAARSGGMQVLTVGAQALISVTHVLLARLFGRAVFGSYQACLAILDLMTRAGTGGGAGGMLRYVAGPRSRGQLDEVRSAVGTGLRLTLVASAGVVLLLVAGAGPLARLMREPALEGALRIMAPAVALTACWWTLVSASLAAKTTRANFYVRGIGEPVTLLVAGVTAALFGRSLGTLAVSQVFAAAATLLMAIVAVGWVFGPGELRRSLGAPRLPGFVRFSLPLGASDVLNGVMQRANIILLTTFVGTSAAGIYAAAEFITRVIASARTVFDSVAAPVFSEALHLGQRERLRDNLVMMNRWVVSVAAPIALTTVVLRRELLALYGPGFREGATALAILAVAHTVNVSFGLSGWVLVGGGRSRTLLQNNLLVALVNIGLGLALIPRYGLLGTAFAQLGGVVLLHLLVFIEVAVGFGAYPFDRTILKPAAALGAATLVEVIVDRTVTPIGARVPLVIVGGLGAYLTALVALGLAPEERRLLAAAKARLRGRPSA
jgi:O-antigen/teichoic acid export membrane protein